MSESYYMIGGLPALRRTTAFDLFEIESKGDRSYFAFQDTSHRCNNARLNHKEQVKQPEDGCVQDKKQELSRERLARYFLSMDSLKCDSSPHFVSIGTSFRIRDLSDGDGEHSGACTAIRTTEERSTHNYA